jgi:hypothetical protein
MYSFGPQSYTNYEELQLTGAIILYYIVLYYIVSEPVTATCKMNHDVFL